MILILPKYLGFGYCYVESSLCFSFNPCVTLYLVMSLYLLNYQFLRTEGLFIISSKIKVSLCLGVLAGKACSDWHSVSSAEKHNERNTSAQQCLSFDSVQKLNDEMVLPTWQASHFTSIKFTEAFTGMTRVCSVDLIADIN